MRAAGLDRREGATPTIGVGLTCEFDTRDLAEPATRVWRERGEHIEGPVESGA